MHEAIALHQGGMSVMEIAHLQNLTEGRVYQIFRGHGYKLPTVNPARGAKKLWDESELSYLRGNLDKPTAELALQLNRTYTSVKSKLYKLDLHTHYHCVVCETEISQKGRYCTDHNWIERKISQAVYRSKKRGLEYNLTDDQAIAILSEPCTYCGGEAGGLDRTDSSIGYTKANTVPCCGKCNTMKMDRPVDEWFAQMKRILEHSNGH